jgi:hypothetical protein
MFTIVDPLLSTRNNNPVEIGVILDKVCRRLFDDPRDVRIGVEFSERGQGRECMDNIADGAQFYDKNIHTNFISFIIAITDRRDACPTVYHS